MHGSHAGGWYHAIECLRACCPAIDERASPSRFLSQFYTVLPEEVLKGVEKSGANTDTWCIVSVGQPTSVGCVEGRTDDKQPTSCYEPCKMSLTGEGSKEAVGYEISMCPDAPEVDEGAPDCPYPGHGDRSYKPALYIFYLEWTTCASGTRTRDATRSRAHQIRRGRPTRLPRARVLPREVGAPSHYLAPPLHARAGASTTSRPFRRPSLCRAPLPRSPCSPLAECRCSQSAP